MNVAGSYDGPNRTVKLDQPLELSTPQLTVTQTDKSGTRTLLKDEKLHVSLAGTVSVPKDAMVYFGKPGKVPYRQTATSKKETAHARYTPAIPEAGSLRGI